jgi:methyl coenzyme M reductase subunit C-like uncharacterized protein (methanogenesis marker protein 7)
VSEDHSKYRELVDYIAAALLRHDPNAACELVGRYFRAELQAEMLGTDSRSLSEKNRRLTEDNEHLRVLLGNANACAKTWRSEYASRIMAGLLTTAATGSPEDIKTNARIAVEATDALFEELKK